MVSPSETIYVLVDEPAPETQPVPLRFLPSKTEQPRHEDSWWESLLGKLPLR